MLVAVIFNRAFDQILPVFQDSSLNEIYRSI
jgi:hypothetical protein